MSETQNTNPSTPRDYDKESIVIEDYNPLFLVLMHVYLLPIMVWVYIFNPGNVSDGSLFRNIFIIIPLMMLPYFKRYIFARGNRKIILTNSNISFLHNNFLLESIKLEDIVTVKKTYSDLYHPSQYTGDFGKLLSYIFLPLAFYIHITLLISKFFFHLFKDGYKSYHFYDAVIVFAGDRFINILPTTLEEYQQVQEFFRYMKIINVDDMKIYYDLSHMYEKISIEGK